MLDFLKTWQYMKARKMYWLLPIIAVLLILGLLIVFGGSSAVHNTIYPMF